MELRKTWILRLDGLDTEVDVVRDGAGHVWVETSSGERIVDAIVLDEGRTVSIRRAGRMHLVDLTHRQHGPAWALVNGRGGTVEILDELAAAAAQAHQVGSADTELRALMPGLVADVKVDVGQRVHKGDAAVVLEAMKMQNELTVPGDGLVQEILVKPGDSVDAGALLLRVAPIESPEAAQAQEGGPRA
jgi:biotin carboxyl carrier protein